EISEQAWSQWFAYSHSKVSDPYLLLASDWEWYAFDRALCAHMRGDDHLAMISAHALLPIQAAVEARAAARHFPVREVYRVSDQPVPSVGFLHQLPQLAADQERRAQEAAYTPILDMPNPPKGVERIERLIHDLELVQARQFMQPGGVNLQGDRIV